MAVQFPPVGRCIYCGATDGLTIEHIVPFALNGNLELPAASCPRCSVITSRFERAVLRGELLPLRAMYRLRTRRPKNRPTSLDVFLSDPTGKPGPEEKKVIAIEDFPTRTSWALMDYGVPGVLRGIPPWEATARNLRVSMPQSDAAALVQQGGGKKAVTAASKVSPKAFAQLIAKIGHGYATAILGDGAFRPYLREFILGASTMPLSYWIGTEHPPRQELDYFSIGLDEVIDIHGQRHIRVWFRTLGFLLTPTYNAIVGRLGDRKLPPRESRTHSLALDFTFEPGWFD